MHDNSNYKSTNCRFFIVMYTLKNITILKSKISQNQQKQKFYYKFYQQQHRQKSAEKKPELSYAVKQA